MFKRFSLALVLAIILTSAKAQFDTSFAKTNMRHCADSLAQGFRTSDWELFTRYSYPAMIGALGGKKEFIAYLSQMFREVPDTAWKLYKPGNILQLVKSGKDLQGIIELHTVVEWQGVRVTTTSYLVAESWNDGFSWTFFDSQGDRNATKVINPGLSDLLIIPARKEKMEPLAASPGNDKSPAKSKN